MQRDCRSMKQFTYDKGAIAILKVVDVIITKALANWNKPTLTQDRADLIREANNRDLGDKPGEGKEVVIPKEQVIIHNNSDAFRHWVSDIKGYPFALLGHSTGVWLPPGVTLEQFQKEWSDYELANNPAKQKEAKP
jgi:hypothetical protein